MKKKVLIIVLIVVAVAAAIIIAAIYSPKVQSDQAAGTIGKAEKLRKGQFTTEDILLRDDILKDTAAVGRTLEQVLAFGSYMKQQKIIIDTLWIKEIQKSCPVYAGCTGCANCQKATQILRDYSSFLGNSLVTVKATCEILLSAYNGKKQDLSGDVGFKMLSFVQVVDEMVQRDSVLNAAIRCVDEYISNDHSTDKKRIDQITRMKQIRDHMVLDNLMFAVKTGDKKHGKAAASFTMLSVGESLNSVLTGKDQGIGSAVIQSSQGPVGAVLTNSSVSNQLNLRNTVLGVNLIQGVPLGVFNANRIDAVLISSSLISANAINSNVVGIIFGMNMNVVLSSIGLAAIISSAQLNNAPLGVLLYSSLQNVYSSSQVMSMYQSNLQGIFNSANLNVILSSDRN
ncbi:MAG: hypothetical protein WCO63_14135 [Bacteroidota bacterium]